MDFIRHPKFLITTHFGLCQSEWRYWHRHPEEFYTSEILSQRKSVSKCHWDLEKAGTKLARGRIAGLTQGLPCASYTCELHTRTHMQMDMEKESDSWTGRRQKMRFLARWVLGLELGHCVHGSKEPTQGRNGRIETVLVGRCRFSVVSGLLGNRVKSLALKRRERKGLCFT